MSFNDPRGVLNFNAGPANLPYEVLKSIEKDILNFKNTDISILETSHRSSEFMDLLDETETLLRDLLMIPENYKIAFLHGGANQQFSNIAVNISGKQGYILTGNWAKRAYDDAQKVKNSICSANEPYIIASSEASSFCKIPSEEDIKRGIKNETDYIHITDNNTLYGSTFYELPETNIPIIADMTSSLLARKIEVGKYALIYAGFQKNIGPSGTALMIIRDDLYNKLRTDLPGMMSLKNLIDKGSLYNTPSTFNIDVANKVLYWVKKQGGLDTMEILSKQRATILYNVIDGSQGFYNCPIEKKSRSITNVVFRLSDQQKEVQFLNEAKKNNMIGLKGHRDVGGLRASLYIGMDVAHVEKLANFMKAFQCKHEKA